jgi:tetratricopeptide (TPR) repeat protein
VVLSNAELTRLVGLYNQGRIDDALEAGNDLLSTHSADPMLNNMVGVLLARMSRFEEALEHYDKALALRPRYAEAFNNRGNTLLNLGRHDEAIRSYREAIAVMPEYAQAHNNLGNALQETGKLEDAIASFRKALQLKPDYPDALNNLGNAMLEARSFEAAAQSFARALQLQPTFGPALVGYGKSLNLMGFHRQGAESLERGIRLKPDEPRWHNELGNALTDLGRVDDAVECFERALALEPAFAEASSNLGNALSDLGKYDEAQTNYEQAIRLRPRFCEAHYNLSLVKEFNAEDEQLAQLHELSDDNRLPDEDRCYVCFALGKAYEDIGDFDKSFSYYAEGNRLRKRALGYDIDRDREHFDKIRSLYAAAARVAESWSPAADSKQKRPIFIVGMPRSGTTLVEQILASHSTVHGAGEQHAVSRILSPIQRDFDSTPGEDVPVTVLDRIRDGYLAEIDYLAGDLPVVTDKMPGNFVWAGLLLCAMPEAKIVNVRRNPVATCWSMFRRLFGSNGFTNDLADLASYYGMYEEHMAFWHSALPGRIYDLDYESLTEHQEPETRALLDFCELDWEPGCLEFHATRRAVRTPSGSQVRKKMYKGSSEAWRRYEAHLGPLLSGLKAIK